MATAGGLAAKFAGIETALEDAERALAAGGHVREKDLATFIELARIKKPETPQAVPLHVLVPAFIVSELRRAFEIGFLIFLPFLIIDMVVASVLMSMGMMMLPPIMISLPFKIIFFVLVDGWTLIATSLVKSFG